MDTHIWLYGMGVRCCRLGVLSPKLTFLIVEKGRKQERGVNSMSNNIRKINKSFKGERAAFVGYLLGFV